MSKKTYPSWQKPEIKVTVSPEYHQQMLNISHNLGESINSLVRPKIRELINSFPDDIRNTRKKL